MSALKTIFAVIVVLASIVVIGAMVLGINYVAYLSWCTGGIFDKVMFTVFAVGIDAMVGFFVLDILD